MTRKRIVRSVSIVAGCLVVLAGCDSNGHKPDPSSMKEFFSDYDQMAIHKFADVQARNGAAADATLQPAHFDGAALNSLGRQKLDAMTADRGERVTTIYMNFAEDGLMEERREAVLAYAGTAGIAEADLKFVSGSNPHVTSPAAGHLARIERTESTGGGDWATDPGTFTGPTK